MKLVTNANCFCPHPTGNKDLLIAGGKIIKMANPGELMGLEGFAQVIPCDGLYAFPGIIDQHAHIIGGGGEDGPASSIGEIEFEDIINAGVTTLVGVLGADSCTKSLRRLYAKAKSLELLGLSTYMYTGSYALPAPTLTGSIADDLVLIDKVIGTGEVAISDHRSSMASIEELIKLASETHMGGLLGGKAGVLHIHVGDGKDGLDPLLNLLDKTDLPVGQFVPTHVNRNEELFRQSARFNKSGGTIDLTAGEYKGVSVPDAIRRLIAMKADTARITISSDANGSNPGGGAAQIQSLYEDIKACILGGQVPPETAFRFVTENVARLLKLYPAKGILKEGSDADILVTDNQYNIQKLFCKGNLVISDGKAAGFVL